MRNHTDVLVYEGIFFIVCPVCYSSFFSNKEGKQIEADWEILKGINTIIAQTKRARVVFPCLKCDK